jgi:Fic family protein
MLDEKFSKRLENLSTSIWQKLIKIDRLREQWTSGAKLNPQVLGRLWKSVLVTSTGASTRIEGSKMTDEDIEKMIRGIHIQNFRDRDKQEVEGYYELLQNVFSSYKTIKFSESTIKHFHKELLKYADKDKEHRGEYKKTENKVHMVNELGESIGVLFDTTKAYLTPKEMQELVEWTIASSENQTYETLTVIGNFIIEFLNIHPFKDGNGRLSRILTNLLLLKSGYPFMPYISHEKLIEDNKPEYYNNLRKSQKTLNTKNPDISCWLDFFLDIILKQSQLAVGLLSEENIEKLLSKKQLLVWEYLQSVEESAPLEITERTKVKRPTVNQVLVKLLQLEKVERIGLGRGTRYRIKRF